LIGHSFDVALATQQLLHSPTVVNRLAHAAGMELTEVHLARLTVLAGLHDVGKTVNGFQERINGRGHGTSHLAEILGAIMANRSVAEAVGIPVFSQWFSGPNGAGRALFASICHHGGPVSSTAITDAKVDTAEQIRAGEDYDPLQEIQSLFACLLERFPLARQSASPLQWTPAMDHLFAGLVMLADWMGSSLPVIGANDRPEAVAEVMASLPWTGGASGADAFSILPGPAMGAQIAIGDVDDRLVIVEAPTGTGKTETAVLHALKLMNQGAVDGFYFAVPTRSAATELHGRIAALVGQHSPALAGRVVRAVAGQLDTDPWQRDTQSWAIGCSKRIMAASVAVGTIDQAMLSVLRARHAWMRHAALSRLLLVVDEAHASDPYMAEVVRTLVGQHVQLGGYALLMSATLGESMRADIERRPRLSLSDACKVTYPSVAGVSVPAPAVSSSISIQPYNQAVVAAAECWRAGGCALVIRSTVDGARAAAQELRAVGVRVLLHHSRFADIDRRYLDQQVIGAIGKQGTREPIVIVATQTCEQSLDIDADLLVCDPAPADVLLQRRGRLGRHRPDAVLPMIIVDAGDVDRIAKAVANLSQGKRVRMPAGAEWAYVYDLISTVATMEWLEGRTVIRVPDDVREWVEIATHPESLDQVAAAHGWDSVLAAATGGTMALRQAAASVSLDFRRWYMEQPVVDDVATRFGDGCITVELYDDLISPLTGEAINAWSIPARWLKGVPAGTLARVQDQTVTVGNVMLSYTADGLSR
jgi:CRISPR-associated endonuclease/helicase Cas3